MSQYGNMSRTIAGMPADVGEDRHIESGRVAEETIGFGIPVAKGADDDHLKKVGSLSDTIRGITRLIHNGKGEYNATDVVSYMRKGRMNVPVSTTGVAEDEAGYVDLADAEFRMTNDSNGGVNPQVPGVFRRGEDEAGIAIFEINIP